MIFTRRRRVSNESWVAIFDKERLHAILFLWEGDHTFLEKGCGTYSRDDDLRLILRNGRIHQNFGGGIFLHAQ